VTSAADLPDGSIVATHDAVYIKTNPTKWSAWRSTWGGYHSDRDVQDRLVEGATVLRIGDGT
jgi:hypothetical protein